MKKKMIIIIIQN